MLLFAGTLILYFLLPQKLRNPLLLVASYVFYAAYSLGLTLFLVVMTLITYVLGLEIGRCREARPKTAKAWMIVGVIISLGTLAFYKYFNFLSDTLAGLSGAKNAAHLALLVPLGISFVVFTLVSYLVDVYRGKIPAERNLLKYALFVSFFPKVVQGPIEKAGDILPQFDEKHSFDLVRFREGMLMVLYGLFMKMVVADTAGIAVDTVYNSLSEYSGAAILVATLLFTLQIYCDFAGYSLVAIGSARVLGFTFKQNFRQPYLSLSVAEFWRRWHISLGAFFRDYVYIPLGGNRRHQILNLAAVWFLTGLWHGSSWNFILWGIYFLLLLIIEKLVFRNKLQKVTVISNLLTIYLLLVGWTLFYFTDLNQVLEVLKAMHGLKGVPLWDPIYNSYFINNIAVIVACLIACMPLGRAVKRHMDIVYEKFPDMWFVMTFVYDFALLFICLSGIVGSGYNAFMYFQF
jgi:alginate O-acetyltransferase complex protein AlgI